MWDRPKLKDSKGNWKLSGKRMEHLEWMIKSLGKRDVKMLIYLSPIHPIIRKRSVVDDDGTSKKGYQDLARRLKELERKYPNLIFVDLLQGGNHGFDSKLFCDLDHLNEAGAKKLTQTLEAIRQKHEGK